MRSAGIYGGSESKGLRRPTGHGHDVPNGAGVEGITTGCERGQLIEVLSGGTAPVASDVVDALAGTSTDIVCVARDVAVQLDEDGSADGLPGFDGQHGKIELRGGVD